jgi:tetratricopeptide (TPR) repeat protein
MRLSILLLTLIASSTLLAPAQGEVPLSDHASETRALVQRLVLDRAAAVASVQRIADEREEQLFAELTVKDQRLRAEQRTRKEAQAELAEVTAERQRLVDKIASRDRQFAAEIEEYRRQVASIADSPDPRKREALKRYAEGDRAGGFDALVAIQKAETKAVAAGWREIAALAKDRKDRGEMGSAEVIPLYETAQTLDSEYAGGWIELRRLYQETGRLADARHAAEQALAHAQNDRDRAVSESELGDVLFELGDLAGARARFEEYLKLSERLAAADLTSADAQRDLSVSRGRLGDVLVALGDPVGARDRFEVSRQIAERLAAANPTSLKAQRDLSISLSKLGEVLATLGDLMGARVQIEESFKIDERLAAANPASADAQRNLSISLSLLGDMLVSSGDLTSARGRLEECFKILERLAAANPSSADAQRDLSASLERLGDVLFALGDLASARDRFEASLQINERLAKSNPSSAVAQRDMFIAHIRLGNLTGGELHLREALRIVLDLQSQGRLNPRDTWMIDDLQKRVNPAEKPVP